MKSQLKIKALQLRCLVLIVNYNLKTKKKVLGYFKPYVNFVRVHIV